GSRRPSSSAKNLSISPILCVMAVQPLNKSVAKKKSKGGIGSERNSLTASGVLSLIGMSDITPLARNEWICLIESAKKTETRTHRIEGGCSSLKEGKRRPCCWPGCPHR